MQLCKCPKGNLNKKLLHINKICKHLCKDCLFPHVGGIDDHVEVLVDVVHNLGLKEGLGAVVHNLVAELRLGNVLPKLLDPRAPGLLGAALVNDLITLVLRGLPILESRHQFLDHFKLSAEEWILVGVHDVVVHLEYVTVDARYGVQKAVEGGRDLKLLEEAGDHTGSGGARQTDLANERRDHSCCQPIRAHLVIDDDRRHDPGPGQGRADHVEVLLGGRRGVTGGDLDLAQAWVRFLEMQELDLNFLFVLRTNQIFI